MTAQQIELLPAREALFIWSSKKAFVAANNQSAALNAGTVLSLAASGALQGISISQ